MPMWYHGNSDRSRRRSEPVHGMAVNITGDLVADDPIRIEGIIEGDVRGTVVVVGRKASVTGSICAESANVAGRVDGLIKAKTVTVYRHGRLTGEIVCDLLEIEAGAAVLARCKAWP